MKKLDIVASAVVSVQERCRWAVPGALWPASLPSLTVSANISKERITHTQFGSPPVVLLCCGVSQGYSALKGTFYMGCVSVVLYGLLDFTSLCLSHAKIGEMPCDSHQVHYTGSCLTTC